MGELRTLRLVVASPSDVKQRDVLKHVIEELNDGIAATCGVQLKFSRWEDDAYAGCYVDGPQGLINAILRIPECDIFLGIFGSRFGTPTSDGRTGTEHEFTLAYETWKQRQRPQIMVFQPRDSRAAPIAAGATRTTAATTSVFGWLCGHDVLL